MKITIYTITDCAFSKQEKEYLSSHGLTFEEKNLETNREFLTEMLAVGSNFAGTPLTKIEKDDGQIVVLKGFTLAEFDKTLGFAVESAKPAKSETMNTLPVLETAPPQQTEPATIPTETDTALPTHQVPAPESPLAEQPITITPVSQPEQPQVATPMEDSAMLSVLNNLQQQAQASNPPLPVDQTAAPSSPIAPPQPPVVGTPVIPDPKF